MMPTTAEATAWHEQTRAEMVRVGHSLFARGYVHATAGNLSVRVPSPLGGGLLITPTDACLGFLTPDDMVWVGDNDDRLSTHGSASKTSVLHRRIYVCDPQAQAIIHTHSTHLVALTLRPPTQDFEDVVPPITPYFVMKVGHVPRIPYHRPGDPRVADHVAALLARYQARGHTLRGVMLDRLGPNVWHQSLRQAMATLEELEETAKLWHGSQLPGAASVQALTTAQIDELQQQFHVTW